MDHSDHATREPAGYLDAAKGSTMILGIDGGGTSCRARLVDLDGTKLGEGSASSANLTLGQRAAAAVRSATAAAFAAAGLPLATQRQVRAGMGLAGANVPHLAGLFRALHWPFASMRLTSDLSIACLGAHAGRDGAVLILGTGSAGLVIVSGRATSIGGSGFLLGDDASGAALGRAAVRAAVAAVDGSGPQSQLTSAVSKLFEDDPAKALAWARDAIPRDYAALAPLAFDLATSGDVLASAIVREAARQVDQLVARLLTLGAARVALVGGLAAAYRPWVDVATRGVLVEPLGDALDGAILLASQERDVK